MTGSDRGVVYLESSAIVKLFVSEPGSQGIAERIKGSTRRATSVLAMVEVPRAAARRGVPVTPAAVRRKVGRMVVVGLQRSVVVAAGTKDPPGLRALDAIHLATALEIGPELDAFLTYDRRLALAARDAGLPVESPGVDIWAEP